MPWDRYTQTGAARNPLPAGPGRMEEREVGGEAGKSPRGKKDRVKEWNQLFISVIISFSLVDVFHILRCQIAVIFMNLGVVLSFAVSLYINIQTKIHTYI